MNIGIGGSDLGPRMAHQALPAFSEHELRMEFVSNIDGAEYLQATRDLLDELSPRSLGTLIALYKHKVLTEGTTWDVDSFDQWDVELGKILATTITGELTTEQPTTLRHDASTNELIHRYRDARERSN